MKNSKTLSLLLTFIMLVTACMTFTNISYAKTSKISMELDKTKADVGDIIVATIEVENISALTGYQINIKYDPEVLQAVDPVNKRAFGKNTFPGYGTILENNTYIPFKIALNDINKGIINFSSVYTDMEGYKSDGVPEQSGVLAKIGFKVLKDEESSIRFEDTDKMPNVIEGTYLWDWNGEAITGYKVEQPALINEEIEVTPTQKPTQTATTKPTLKPTPTTTNKPTSSPTKKPIQGYVEMDLNKADVEIGDIITATIRIKNIRNISAYQFNVKYDPKMLRAIDPKTGENFNNNTFPSGGKVLVNEEYGTLKVAVNDITKGVLNFSSSYLYLSQYKESGEPEDTGIICKIGFKALKTGKTSVKFMKTEEMPEAISGIAVFDWDSERITGYDVNQSEQIKIVEVLPTTTPDSDPTSPAPTPKKTPSTTSRPSRTPRQTRIPTVTEEPEIVIPGSDGKVHNAYLSGYPDGSFKPEKKITRAEAAVIFANLLEANESTRITGDTPEYTDLDNDHWAAWAIKYVSSKELFSGYPDGSFKPNRNITRAEFSTVVFKLLKASKVIKEVEIDEYIFDDSEGHWARQHIEQLAELGYINGYPDGTFMPDYNIKRAESVALINRALKRGPLKGTTQIFPDVPTTHWAFEDIAEGSIDHTFVIDGNGNEKLKEILSD